MVTHSSATPWSVVYLDVDDGSGRQRLLTARGRSALVVLDDRMLIRLMGRLAGFRNRQIAKRTCLLSEHKTTELRERRDRTVTIVIDEAGEREVEYCSFGQIER